MPHTSTLTKRGTTSVPATVRAALQLQPGDALAWHVLPHGAVQVHRADEPRRPTLDDTLAELRAGLNRGPNAR